MKPNSMNGSGNMEKQCEAQEKKQAEREEALRSKVRELEHALQTTQKMAEKKIRRD